MASDSRANVGTVLLLALAGCAVPYAKKGTTAFAGGFEDKQLGPGHYAISVEGNGFTSYELAEQYFHRRAAELCAGMTYTSTVRYTTVHHTEYFYGPSTGVSNHYFPVVEGEVTCSQRGGTPIVPDTHSE
jgi:hypothetical protein